LALMPCRRSRRVEMRRWPDRLLPLSARREVGRSACAEDRKSAVAVGRHVRGGAEARASTTSSRDAREPASTVNLLSAADARTLPPSGRSARSNAALAGTVSPEIARGVRPPSLLRLL